MVKKKETDCIKRKDLKKIKAEIKAELYNNIKNITKLISGCILIVLGIFYLFFSINCTEKFTEELSKLPFILQMMVSIGNLSTIILLFVVGIVLLLSMEDLK